MSNEKFENESYNAADEEFENLAPAESVSPAPQPATGSGRKCPDCGDVDCAKAHFAPVKVESISYRSGMMGSPVAAPQEVTLYDYKLDKGLGGITRPVKVVLHSDYREELERVSKNLGACVAERDEIATRAEKAESQLADMRKALQTAQQDLEVAHKLLKSVKP